MFSFGVVHPNSFMAENEVFQISNMDALTVLSIWDTGQRWTVLLTGPKVEQRQNSLVRQLGYFGRQ